MRVNEEGHPTSMIAREVKECGKTYSLKKSDTGPDTGLANIACSILLEFTIHPALHDLIT